MQYSNTMSRSGSAINVTELLRLSTASGRTYLIINMVDNHVMEILWYGFTPELIFRAGIDTITDLMIKHHPVGLIFNVLEHKSITKESQRYAAAATLDYVKKYFVKDISRQRFKRIIVTRDNTILPETEEQPSGYFMRLSEARVETIILESVEEAYKIFEFQISNQESEWRTETPDLANGNSK